MFKRANKITALLVAAAAVVSIVPATAANAAERLGTKEGTVTKAYAFKDGKYIYEGYKTDDDNNSVYYNAGAKDKELEDLTDAKLYDKYNTNAAIAKDGSDEYLVDLSTGKVSDEDLASDDQSTATDKLRSKLKKTDRCGEDVVINKVAQPNGEEATELLKVSNNQFGEVWYQYSATTTGGATVSGKTFGYTDKTGKYVDAGKTANIRVFNGTKMVKIDEFDEATEGITASIDYATAPVTVAQDKDYFYTVVTVKFTTGTVQNLDKEPIPTAKYLMKISKTQGDKEKDAYLPKTVEAYELVGKQLTDTTKDIVSGDATTAVDKLVNGDSSRFIGTRVVDGTIYYTEMDNSDLDKVKTYKIKLQKNEKVEVAGLSGKVDAYVVKKDGDKDQDVKGAKMQGVSIDIDGNVWVINEGKILKSEKAGDFKEMFTCDRSLDCLDVYNAGSLVAWDASGDVYTTVQEGKSEANKEVTPAQTGWVNTAAGWTFFDAAGKQVKGAWTNAGGVWYMMKADGIMATGWYNDNGTWYYLQSSGAMKTGWLNDNGTWYYLNASGAMLANTTVDGYTLGANGAWVK